MPWGFAAAAGIGAIGSIVAGGEQASGQEAAARTQQNMFNTIVGQEKPFLQGGYSAEDALLNGLGLPSSYNPSSSAGSSIPLSNLLHGGIPGLGGSGIPIGTGGVPGSSATPTAGLPAGYFTQTFNPTMQDLENYPGYQFQLKQGDLAVNSSNSVGSSALSGPALKSLMSFNQGLAASNYQNYFNQFQTQQNNIFNRLNSIATMGQNAAANLGTAGTQLGTGIAQAQAGAAGSIAGGIAGATNNIGQSVLLANMYNGGGGSAAPSYPATQTASDGYTENLPYGG